MSESIKQDLSVYTESDRSDHEIAKAVIATTLANEAVGKANAISSADLAERTPVSASTVRDLIKEVRLEYRLPIGNSNGYFIIDSQKEANRQIERQRRQAETSYQTARDIAAAWNQSNETGIDG